MTAPAYPPCDPLPLSLAALIEGYRRHRVEAGESGAAVERLEAAGRPTLHLKYGEGRVADDVVDEAMRLRWLMRRIATPGLVTAVADADAAWLLTTALPGRSGDDWFEDGREARRRVTVAIALFLRDLHALPIAECPFDAGPVVRMAAARANVNAGRVDLDDFVEDHAGWTAEQVWNEVVSLAPGGIDAVVTHGDFSLGSVMLDANGVVTGCLDLGRVGVADRYQDIAILHQNLVEFDEGLPELFLETYGVGAVDARKLRFHRCLDELF